MYEIDNTSNDGDVHITVKKICGTVSYSVIGTMLSDGKYKAMLGDNDGGVQAPVAEQKQIAQAMSCYAINSDYYKKCVAFAALLVADNAEYEAFEVCKA